MSPLFSDVLRVNSVLTHRLIEALRRNDLWKLLRAVIPDTHLSATFSPVSPDELVLGLENSFVTLEDFIHWLELVDAFDALLLLKPDEPVLVYTQPQSPVEIEAGHTSVLRLTCRATSFPPPNYQWYFNDQPLPMQRSPLLEVRPLTAENSGTYSCHVWNIRGSEAFSAASVVTVREPNQNHPPQSESPFYAADKVALLISNSNYLKDVHLPLTVNDVETLAKSLAALNFRVLAFRDLRKPDIFQAVELFCRLLQAGTYSVFYYAGHGFKHCGKDYLQPVDCDSTNSVECVCFQDIIGRIKATPASFNLILLDACRNIGGHATEAVMAPCDPRDVRQAKRSSLVVYATSPYSSAVEVRGHHNGLFMEHLKKHIDRPVSVHEAIRQCLKDLEDHKLSNYQIPVVKYDTPHDYSLRDSIYDGKVYKTNDKLWQSVSGLPPDEAFPLEIATVRVCFACDRDVYCNSMLVKAYLDPQHLNIHTDLRPLECNGATVRKLTSDCKVAQVLVSDLQRLAKPLCFAVELRDLQLGRIVYTRHYSCGYPLVSACRLSVGKP